MSEQAPSEPLDRARRILDEMRTMRDELRVQLHLAGLDARTRWEEDLQPRLEKLEAEIQGAGRDLGESLEARASELRTQLRDLWAKVRPGS